MTREEAIEYWEGLRKTFSSQLEKEENYFGRMHLQTTIDAVDMAISAIRQQEHFREVTKKVEPLTLDELRKMDGEPVWVEFQDGSGGCWGLVHITMFNHVVFANGLYCTVGKPYFGKTWMTYRQKPEEVQK